MLPLLVFRLAMALVFLLRTVLASSCSASSTGLPLVMVLLPLTSSCHAFVWILLVMHIVFGFPVSQRLLGFLAVLFENLVAGCPLALGEGPSALDLVTDGIREALCPLRAGGQTLDGTEAVEDLLVGQFAHFLSLLL